MHIAPCVASESEARDGIDWGFSLLCGPLAYDSALCPSFHLFVSCLRFSWNKKAVETSNLVETALKWVTRRANLSSESKVKVTGNENVKVVFRAYLRQKWIDLRQSKTVMISGLRISSNTFHKQRCFIFVISVYCLSHTSHTRRAL